MFPAVNKGENRGFNAARRCSSIISKTTTYADRIKCDGGDLPFTLHNKAQYPSVYFWRKLEKMHYLFHFHEEYKS